MQESLKIRKSTVVYEPAVTAYLGELDGQVFTGHSAQYSHLRIICSHCEVIDKQQGPRPKFAPRTVPDILLGYASDGRDNTCVYRVCVPSLRGGLRQVRYGVDVHILEPSSRVLLQKPAALPPAGQTIPAEDGAQARETQAPIRSPVTSDSPPTQSSAHTDRSGDIAGGGRGPSSSGASHTVPVVFDSADMPHSADSIDTSGGDPAPADSEGRIHA
jgi:hypothetical protein